MQKYSLLIAVLVIVAVGALLLASNGFFGGNDPHQVELGNEAASVDKVNSDVSNKPAAKRKSLAELLGVPEEEMVEVGGIKRPKRDVAFDKAQTSAEPISESPFPHPGKAPAIDKDANEQVAGLFEELSQEDGGPLAARSSMFAPEPFDQKKYEADPDAWLNKIRPGRVFQSAQPGPDVNPIATESKPFQNVIQGEKVILNAKVEPGAPVTFYTPQVGEFENRLTTQSVAANEEGVAAVTYTATEGTLGIVNIMAASPANSGRLNFRVNVSLPDK